MTRFLLSMAILMGLAFSWGLAGCGGDDGGPPDADVDAAMDVPVSNDLATEDPGMADPGEPDAGDDTPPPDAGPDAACECRDNEDCEGAFPDLGACEIAVCNPETCACVRGNAPAQTACDDGDPCTSYDRCEDGACVPGTNLCECEGDGDCAAFEDGDFCNGTLVCDLEAMPRVCVVDPETIHECIDEDDDPCRGPVCDPETGDCVPDQPVNEGGDCDDLDACTDDDACVEGFCLGETEVTCDDGIGCTTDSCDSDTGCLFVPNTLPCEDGEPCTVGDVCAAGECVPGEWDPCDDGNDCTADECNAGVGCIHTELTGTSCEEGDLCTDGDTCDAGNCMAGDPTDCEDGDPCTDDSCESDKGCLHEFNTAPCSDMDPCTTGDVCFEGDCLSGEPVVCDDEDPCTIDSCDPDTGECVFEAKDLDDGSACTLDACDPDTGEITHVPISCDDGDACNGVETCDPATGCVAGTPPACDDGDACNGVETCDPATGCVAGTPPVCGDGNACNGVETCDPAKGCVAGTPPVCDDGDACNGVETCDPVAGCLAGTPPMCDDGDACNGVETCDPATGCVAGTPPVCDDGDVCTGVSTCDPALGCVEVAPPLVCDDGDACNGVETCDPDAGCQPGEPLVCDDDDLCNGVYACDDQAGCVEVSPPPGCDDENACNGLETCHPVDGCQPGTPVVCEDTDPCKDFTCNPLTGACDADLLTGPLCDDADPCTANDACALGECTGTEVCCTDGIDNDGNGVADCLDAGCADEPTCHDPNLWCRLQYPETLAAIQEQELAAYGRLYLAGVTDQGPGNDPRPWLKVQFGFGTDADPAAWGWVDASPNPGFNGNDWGEPNNDEYVSTAPAPAPGTYAYAFRASGDNGQTWTYCDLNRGPGLDGSEDGFALADAGALTVAVANVFFSEYIEGTSNNKAVEIYNAEALPVALRHCRVRGYANGSVTQSWAITLDDAFLPSGETFVLCNTGWALGDDLCQQKSGGLTFNGDDAVVLECGGAVVDSIGQIGVDPGSEWGSGPGSTMDNTLVRKCSVGIGDREPTDVFDPSVEWDGHDTNTISFLGDHVQPCP